MHKLMLIIAREYLVRVRTRAFVLFTLLMPLFVALFFVVPGKLMTEEPSTRRVGIVAADPLLAGAVRLELATTHLPAPGAEFGTTDLSGTGSPAKSVRPEFDVMLEGVPSEALRQQLSVELRAGRLDGVAWIDADAVTTRKVTY
jgi:ABC-2 type transport system permease protein